MHPAIRLYSGAEMGQLVAMGTITSVLKKLGIGAVNIVSSLALLSRPLVGSLGDVQAVSGVAGTVVALIAFLNSLPIWFVVTCFLTSLAYLIWSAIQDDLTRARAITEAKEANARGMAEVKKANTHAWGFEPEFRDAMIAIAADREEFKKAVAEMTRIRDAHTATTLIVADEVEFRFHQRAEKIVKDIFGGHFAEIRAERQFDDQKLLRDQTHSVEMVRSMAEDFNRKLDARLQALEGTAKETPQ